MYRTEDFTDVMVSAARTVSRSLGLLAVLILCAGSAEAARHALLVGIGDYPGNALDLSGPKYDVEALQDVLVQHWQFEPGDITILMDRDATKKAVLNELRALKQRSAPGDQLFFYYSGHGTSARDEAVSLPLPDMTAGLLPHDVVLNLSKHEIVASLIVGRTDLRPIFKDIDESGRQLLVMIDACYSGNAVRGFSLPEEKMRIRYVPLDSKVDSLLAGTDTIKTRGIAAAASEQAYPYNNVFFIAASGEYEEAADISGPYLEKFPTIDGKPHGAFSDAMLRVMSGAAGKVDVNNDSRITNLEASQGIEKWMAGKFPQTPQHLPPAEEDHGNLASRSIFGDDGEPLIVAAVPQNQAMPKQPVKILTPVPEPAASPQSAPVADGVKIALDASSQYLTGVLSDIQGVSFSTVYPDLMVVRTTNATELRSGANDLIIAFAPGDESGLISRIKQEVSLQQFLRRLTDTGNFELSLDVVGKQNNGPHLGGEQVSFSLRADSNAWLVLLNIDREGGINVLFPVYGHEQRVQPRNLVLETPQIEVVAPFGSDRIVAIGFQDKPAELFSWLGELPARIPPQSSKLEQLFELIKQYQSGSASHVIPFITVSGL